MSGDEFFIAEHGTPAGHGRRGTKIDPSRVRIIGHSHNHTPPFWRRMWLRLRGKWPVRYVVNGSFGAHIPYNQGPSQWDNSIYTGPMRDQIRVYQEGAMRNLVKGAVLKLEENLGKTADPMEALRAYCEQDAEIERRLYIKFTQPAARFADDGTIYYDSWHWTGRTK